MKNKVFDEQVEELWRDIANTGFKRDFKKALRLFSQRKESEFDVRLKKKLLPSQFEIDENSISKDLPNEFCIGWRIGATWTRNYVLERASK